MWLHLFFSLFLLLQRVGILLDLLLEGLDFLDLLVASLAQFGDLFLCMGTGPFEGYQVVEDDSDEPQQREAQAYFEKASGQFWSESVFEQIPENPDDGDRQDEDAQVDEKGAARVGGFGDLHLFFSGGDFFLDISILFHNFI